MTKLTSYASLVGVIGAISGGAMWIGELTTRLEAIENKEFVVNETVDLSDVHQKIADLDKEVQGDTAVTTRVPRVSRRHEHDLPAGALRGNRLHHPGKG